MTVGEVVAQIERDFPFYDESGGGVTFSGGEPLLQWSFLLDLLRACRERGIHTAVDTCGFCAWEHLDAIRKHVDLFLYDLKLMDEARHGQLTGASNDLILANLETLSRAGHSILLRVPVIPGANDDDDNVRQIGRFAASLSPFYGVDLLPYHNTAVEKYKRLDRLYELAEAGPVSADRMADVAQILRGFGLAVRMGG